MSTIFNQPTISQPAPLKNEYYEAEYRDGIVRLEYYKNLNLKLEDARQIVQTRVRHFGEKPYPGLVLSTPIKNVDREGRNYFFTHGMTNLLAMAIVETDHVCRLMLTAYLTIFKTEAPVKIFKKEEEANRWLRQFLPA